MLNAKVRNNREDTVVGQRGILTLDLDRSSRACALCGIRLELWRGFILQDAGGEWVMPQDCPKFARGGGGRGGGVKAPEGWRSPHPGGQGSAPVLRSSTAEGGLHPLRRGVNTADGGWVGMEKTPVRAVAAKRTGFCHPGVEDFLLCRVPPRALFETPEYLEWVWTAISQSAGNEMVTCAEIASYRVVFAADADAECHPRSSRARTGGGCGCFREAGRMVPPLRGGGSFSSVTMGVARRHPWLLAWHPSRMRSRLERDSASHLILEKKESTEFRGDFVLQDAGGRCSRAVGTRELALAKRSIRD